MLSSKFKLPRIYPITDTYISGISHIEQVQRLILGGARMIQIRDKRASSAELYAAAKECVAFARKTGVLIIINDRTDIAMAAGAGGVHLGQEDMPADMARELLGTGAIIGLSTHSLEQAREAIKMPVDYIAVGPIFDTGTKERTDPVIGLRTLKMIREEIGPFSLAAIGGIDDKNIQSVLTSGADSAAIISALIKDTDAIEQKMRRFTSLT